MIPTHRAPTHPGEILLEEFLNPLGLTQIRAAALMRIPLNRLNEIIRGRRGVTADTAIRLATLLGTTPDFWMNLQSTWDIYHAAKSQQIDLTSMLIVSGEETTTSDSVFGDIFATYELKAAAWAAPAPAGTIARPKTPIIKKGDTPVSDKDLELVA